MFFKLQNGVVGIDVLRLFVCSLRPRASSGSSQSERSTSPLVMSSTHSLETMPRFALSTDDEGDSQTVWLLVS